jgi:hypothetical protein
MLIAGHTLINSHVGRACATCHARWINIRNATLADLDKPHFAHVGNLTRDEIREIAAERGAEDARIAQATLTAVGLGIGGMAAGAEAMDCAE